MTEQHAAEEVASEPGAAYVLVIAFVPLFFPHVPFLAMAAMMLGIMEVVMHLAMIKMFRLKHFYSPGLATAVVVLLPISIYTFAYVIRHNVMQPIPWLPAFLYMLFGLGRGSADRHQSERREIQRFFEKRQGGPFGRSPVMAGGRLSAFGSAP